MKRSWKAGIKKQAVILGIWAAAGALLTGCKAAGGSGTGNRLRPLELSSLEYTGRLELEYAEQFAVDLYQDGFQVLTVADGAVCSWCRKGRRPRRMCRRRRLWYTSR